MGFVQLFVEKVEGHKCFLIISIERRKKESKHSFGKESTIWQWRQAEGTKNVLSAILHPAFGFLRMLQAIQNIKSRNNKQTNCSWPSVFCFENINPIGKKLGWENQINTLFLPLVKINPIIKIKKSGKIRHLQKQAVSYWTEWELKMYGYTTWTGT